MHLLIDGLLIRPDLMTAGNLRDWLEQMPARVGMARIQPPIVERSGPNLLGYVLLAESHISLHCAWEESRVFLDVFSCKGFESETVLVALKDIGVAARTASVLERGLEYLPGKAGP